MAEQNFLQSFFRIPYKGPPVSSADHSARYTFFSSLLILLLLLLPLPSCVSFQLSLSLGYHSHFISSQIDSILGDLFDTVVPLFKELINQADKMDNLYVSHPTLPLLALSRSPPFCLSFSHLVYCFNQLPSGDACGCRSVSSSRPFLPMLYLFLSPPLHLPLPLPTSSSTSSYLFPSLRISLNRTRFSADHEEGSEYSGFLIRILNDLQMLIKQLFNKFIV